MDWSGALLWAALGLFVLETIVAVAVGQKLTPLRWIAFISGVALSCWVLSDIVK